MTATYEKQAQAKAFHHISLPEQPHTTMTDYGYGDTQPDYGYGDSTDYGYGDSAPATDYGYGDSAPAAVDYGYGDTTDYGYGDEAPAMEAPTTRRPKRRCSVTKYSLTSAPEGSAESEMAQQINAHDMINQFRQNGGNARATPEPTHSGTSTVASVATEGSNNSSSSPRKKGQGHPEGAGKLGGRFRKLRKRLSMF